MHKHLIWYRPTEPFPTLSRTFVDTELGAMNAHRYGCAPQHSTFVAECDEATWQRAVFEHTDEVRTRRTLERAFAATLDGHPLLPNHSIWRRFPKVDYRRWSVDSHVLVGDALRTAHFSIASGTRLACEDVIALARALPDHPRDVPAALQTDEAARRPVVGELVVAANRSADWYEHYTTRVRREPWAPAWSSVRRSGRVDADKLQQVAPRFVAGYEAWSAMPPPAQGADGRG